jgi:flagellar hook-length control protein FliK
MQSPPTSSVQLPSLFDLLAPAVSPGGCGQSAFDSLLQPPTPPPTPATDSASPPPRIDNQPKRPDDNSLPPAPAPAEARTSTDPEPQRPAQRSTDSDTSTSNQSPASDSKLQEKADPPAQDNVTAESLAGLVAVQLPTAAASEVKPEEAGNASTSAAAKAKAKTPAGSQTTQALPNGESAAAATQVPTDQAAEAKQDIAAEKQAPTSAKPVDGTNATAKPAVDPPSTLATDKPTLVATSDTTSGILPVGDGKAADGQPSNHHSDQSQADSNPLAQPVTTDPAAQPVSTNTTTPVAAPVAVALPAPVASAGQPATNSASSPSAPPPGSATGPRSRLPADALAPGPRTAARPAPTEIDTARLLSRVAKAFSAAQEREGEVRLRLSPPELGSLRLEVRVQDGALVAQVHTETDSARTALMDNLPALRDRLAEQGVRIERFDVDLMQRQPGGSPDQPGGRQQDAPAPMRLVPPPKPRTDTTSSSTTSVSASAAVSGLNIII